MERGKIFSLDEVYDEKYSGVKYLLAKALERSEPLDNGLVQELISCGRHFSKWGWAPAYNSTGSSGNLGFRDKNGIAVTATNTSLGGLTYEDIMRVVKVDYNTDPPTVFYEKSEERKPTSELIAHWEIFKGREDVYVILHGHDKLTTMMAGIIARYYPDLAARTDKNVPYGTKDFAFALRDKLTNKNKYLIARGHGFFSLGTSFSEALLYARIMHDLTNLILRPYVKVRGSGFVGSHLPDGLEGKVGALSDRLVEPAISLVGGIGGIMLNRVGSGMRIIRSGTRSVRRMLRA